MVLPASTGISRVPAYSGTKPRKPAEFRLRGSHPLRRRFPTRFDSLIPAIRRTCRPLRLCPTTPRGQRLQPVTPTQFGLFPVRSPLLRESLACFLFLRVLRCFSSPGSLRQAYVFSPPMTEHHPSRVPPFGYPRINARLQLPVAFRSLPRPSSPSCAQASTSRPLRLIPLVSHEKNRLTTPSRHSTTTSHSNLSKSSPRSAMRTEDSLYSRGVKWRAG
jgi:hypothetical protein